MIDVINETFNIFIEQISEIFGNEIGFMVGNAISFNLIGIIAIIFSVRKFLGIFNL